MSLPIQTQSSPAPPARLKDWPVYLVALFVFAATSAYTLWSMRGMSGGMDMPGGWTMSMMWMPMPGQSQLAAAGMFMAMWAAMMIAMMLPSAMPMILIYRRVLTHHHAPRASFNTFVMAFGYFLAWSLFGLIVYIGGMELGHLAMNSDRISRAVPLAAAVGLFIAGVYQLTPWKSSCLNHCRDPISFLADHLHGGTLALKMGLHHGIFCGACCWGLMLMQITLGIMNLGAMILIAVLIAVEKMLPGGLLIGKVIGAACILGSIGYAFRAFAAF